MLSAFGNQNLPPLTPPEAETPSLFRQGMANFKDNMKGPRGQVAASMLQQQMGKMGTMFAPGLMPRQPSRPVMETPVPSALPPPAQPPVEVSPPVKDPAASPLAQYRQLGGPRYHQAI